MKIDELKARWNAGTDRYNQWDELCLNEIVAFAQQECLKEAAEKFEGSIPFNWVCADGYSNGFDKEETVEELKKRIADLEQRDKRITAELHEFIKAEDVMVAAGIVTKEKVKQAHEIVQSFGV